MCEDCRRLYPNVASRSRIIIVEAGENVLSSFEKSLSAYALRRLLKEKCEIRLRQQVVKVCVCI